MPDFADLIRQGSGHAWLFVPSAILLGALHGLEPGHSKTMMAAFIVAVRGTVMQAVLLGLAATVSHTAVVWGIAFAGLYLWQGVDAETFEPYFQLASAAIIIGLALWMLWRTWREQRVAKAHAPHSHSHDHAHTPHDHGDHHHHPAHGSGDDQTAHERAHAQDISRRFAAREVTTGQIVLFGLTGGLIPCPAAITVLLLCLQLKAFTLGFALVLSFSIGLAITLVTVGALVALSVRHATSRWTWMSGAARKAPYLSGILIIAVGLYIGLHGWQGLAAQTAASSDTLMTDLAAYAGLFLSALVAATILPMQSEAVLVGLLVGGNHSPALLVSVASLGNILGAVLNWLLGRGIERFRDRQWFPVSVRKLEQAQVWYRRYGKWSLLGSWLPIVGDPLTVVAGVLKEPFPIFLLLVSIAKIGRYLVLAAVTTTLI